MAKSKEELAAEAAATEAAKKAEEAAAAAAAEEAKLLVKMAKAGHQDMMVHPTCVVAHQVAGWIVFKEGV